MVLRSGEWYEKDVIGLLDKVMSGEYVLVIQMVEGERGYDFIEPDLYPMGEIREMLSFVTGGWETIYNILFNYELVRACVGIGAIGVRYLGMDYLSKLAGVRYDISDSFLIEPIERGGSSDLLRGGEGVGRLLWQDNELLRGMFSAYWGRSEGSSEFLSVAISGLDSLGGIFHLLARVPKNLHPEMVSPVIVLMMDKGGKRDV